MSLALILSSYVAAGRMGGGGQMLALAACGIEPVLVPTVMLGRSPARGGRGRAVEADLFGLLIDDIAKDGLLPAIDLVLTGHFSLPEQVEHAAHALAAVRAANPGAVILVDPVLGDEPKGLYVKPQVADAVAALLVPLADWITPNLWELGHLNRAPVATAAQALGAVRSLGKRALLTSAPAGADEAGLLLWDGQTATLFSHPRFPAAPNGTGDLVTALFGAGLAQGLSPHDAARRAGDGVRLAVEAAQGLNELPLARLGARLADPPRGLAAVALDLEPAGD